MSKGLLSESRNIIIETSNDYEVGPFIPTHSSLKVPSRPLAILNSQVKLNGGPLESMYGVSSNSLFSD